jgi:hypothetical protein
MNKRRTRIGMGLLACAALLLGACAGHARDPGAERLASCSIEESPFKGKDFTEWSFLYHRTVSGVIGADTRSLSEAICPDSDNTLPAPTQELQTLAASLDPWKAPARLRTLSEADMGAVLLEYLRTYECALQEYRTFFYAHVYASSSAGTGSALSSSRSSAAPPPQTIEEYNRLQAERGRQISQELRVARAALNRTLALTGRLNRLRPVFYDVNCFVAASLDLRNQLGLAAEVSSCLPRIRDAHSTLRDLKDLEPR